MTAQPAPARRLRRRAGLLAALALAAPLLTACGDDGDEYEALPPTPDYAAPGAEFCVQLLDELAAGERGDDWKVTDWRAKTATDEELKQETEAPTASPSGSASPSQDMDALENIEDGVCAFELGHGTGAERTRSMVALSVIAADDAGVRGLYEHASSQAAAVMELNYDARPTDVPGEWTQSLRAELVPPGRGKVPVDLQDLVLSGNLHANLKAHAGDVARADVEATQAELRWASGQVLAAVVGLLEEVPATP